MKHLIIEHKPIPDIFILEIFEPHVHEDKTIYPVSINGMYMLFENDNINWSTKGMASFVEPKIIQYVIRRIETYPLP